MKTIGYILVGAGFLFATLVAVQEAREVNWMYFVPLALLGFIGVAIIQAGIRSERTSVDKVAANISTLHTSLQNAVTNASKLSTDKESIDVYDMRHRIDEVMLVDLDNFAEAREAIGHKYGLQHYADVMSHFAAGERYLNRVWSASADGYIDEVHAYIDRAKNELQEALGLLQKLEGSTS